VSVIINISPVFFTLDKIVIMFVETVVELMVAELVEASKRPQERVNKTGDFDKLRHRGLPISEN